MFIRMNTNSLLLECHFLYFCIVCIFVTIVKPDLIDEVDQRPQIISRDGAMVFQSAMGKSIHFEVNGGSIFFNEADLLGLTQSVSAAANLINSFHDVLTDFENRLRTLENTVLGSQGIESRVSQLEQAIANGTSGGDLPGNVDGKIKSLVSKVMRLTQIVNKIRTTLTVNECSSNPCRNGGTCEDQYNSFICRCPPNWEGTLCDVDVNECAQFAGTDLGCQNGATCINRIGTYECQCAPGFVGLHCTRKDRGCSKNNPQELCGHGICINQEGVSDGYTCLCDQGWTKAPNSKACTQDVDECNSGKPSCSKNPLVSCINLPGTFHCGPCPQGYTGNGFYCVDVDECQINNGGCSMNPYVQCINTQGSRACGACPPGYQGDGVTCTYLGACRINNGGCHPLAQCLENSAISQSYVQCICPSGYAGSGIGPSGCIPTAVAPSTGGSNVCQPNPCIHGSCIAAGTSYICHCYSGYAGTTCSEVVNPCDSNPCQNSGTCVSQGNGYFCRCSPLTTGMHCEQQQMSCGGRLRSESGTLKFPPSSDGINYPSQVSCGWLIITNDTQVLNVTFKSFNLEESPECSFDWLQIHDGRSSANQLIGQYCGSRIPNGIISTHNVLYLWFRSDRTNQRDGFELTWTSIPPVCGGDISFQSHGSLSSPGYPGKYPINRDCEWRLRAPFRKRILLTFYTMNIENHSNCSFDFVEIRGGYDNRLIKKFCNSSSPAPLTTPSGRAKIRFHSDGEGRDTGFQISYSTVSSSHCGGVLTDPAGTIVPPMDPNTNKYQHRVTCEWIIQLPEGERIKIQFLKLSLEKHRACMYDRVEVHEGQGPESTLVGRYCGNQLPRPYTSNGNILTIIFLSDHSVAYDGFQIKYQEVCGGIFGGDVGHITSPMYPTRYPRNKNCIYEIQQPLGRSITLNFFDFELEARTRYSSRCYDSVEIHDGHDEKARSLGKFCGTEFPPTIISTYNYLWVKFQTDSSREYRGFYANYTTQDISCGGIIRSREGTIQTPRYPNVYPNNHLCRWVIVADPGNVINLNWINFNLEGGSSMIGEYCGFDYVELYENITEGQPGVLVGNRRFCGNQSPPNMTSTSDVVTIIFRTDYSIRYNGFVARYSLVDATNLCSANFVSSTGTILSPGYPNPYPHHKDCTWVITVPSGQQILLNVSDFQLERQHSCLWDYLEIRNGGYASSPLIGRFCGREITTPIPSMSNHMYLRFVSDYSFSLKGFNITWDGTITGCGGVLTGKSGHIISPYYPHQYAVNTECFYKISTSKGSIVQVVFLDFDLEPSRGCYFDYLAFYDGLDSSSELLGKYCSENHPHLIRSTSNNMLIKFASDASHHGRGFSIKYDTVCEVILGGFRGVIESPNFPDRYPSNLNCKWTIQVKNGNKINVTFSHFLLEVGDNCEHDYLQISEGSTSDVLVTRRAKLCGSMIPEPISSSSNKMILEMKTDDSRQFSGFRLEWYLHGCGGHFMDPSGEFTSPNYPNGYDDNIECEWLITTALDKSVELTIQVFDIESSGNCHFDVLTVYGGPDASSPKLHDGLCHILTSPMKLTSSGNNMYLTFRADSSYSGRGFKLSYKSVDSACGGFFVVPSGNIHSHNYPQNYDAHDDCIWYIQVEKDHVVQLMFTFFDLELSDNCTYDYVKLFDGNSTESPEIATLCGNNLPNVTTYRSTGNVMVVRMKADGSLSGPGFFANYTTACGARIVTEDFGTISVSNAINANRENENCSWVIIGAQPYDRVTLTITHMDLSPSNENFANICEYGYLEVFDGEDRSSNSLGPFCGSSVPPRITSHGSAILLHLVSRYGFHYGYFSASYSVIQGECGGNFTSEHGTFASSEYPNTYPINSECVWTISTSPGNRAIVGFRVFDLEPSDNCNKDYLEVRENSAEGNLMGVYCNALPTNITASQTLWIKFHSDNEGTAQGFLADYSLLHGNELQGPSGKIASPLYPRPYLQESEYSWRISVPVGNAIRITFREFYVESFSDACDMYLAIYDGYDDTAPLLMKKCGTMIPDPLTSSSNMVYVYMSTMGVRRGSLFLLEWMQVERTPVRRPTLQPRNDCGGTIFLSNYTSNSSDIEYVLTSPGYPYGYRAGLNCEWIIQAPQLFHPVFQVTAMDVERSPRCTVDYVSIYTAVEQSGGDWRLLKTLCHNNATSVRAIEGNNLMKVVFRSDFSVNGTGFAAKVYPACGSSVNMPDGVIEVDNTTSGVYPDYYIMKCHWNITVRPGRTIKIEFDRFYIRNDDRHCGEMFLKVQNGLYADSPSLGQPKYCGNQLPEIPESTSNHVSITYINIREAQGFRLRFFEVSVSCGGSYTLTQFNNLMEISSPGFPNSPPPHTECIWTFMAPGGEALQVDFDPIFDFQPSKNCETDYVELRDGGTQTSSLIKSFCLRSPSTQRSTQNMIWVKYFTNTYNHPSRFKANVSIARCGGVLRQWRGEIRSPGYPREYPSNTQCTWRIESLHYSSVTVTFQNLDLPSADPCNSTDHVSASEFSTFLQSARHVQTVCGRSLPPPIQIGTRVALIDFKSFSSHTEDHFQGFYLNYSMSYSNCGGEVTGPSGEIKNPDYPSGTQFRSCTWRVTVPKSRRVTINIVDLDMDFRERYTSDISFYNYDYMYFIDSLWRNRTLRTVESSGNIMRIHFYVRTNRPVRFLLRYSSDQPAACGGVLQGQSGPISYPTVPSTSFYCVWEYTLESPSNVTLAVTFRNVTIGRSNNYYNCRYSGSKLRVTSEDDKQEIYQTCGNYTRSETVVSPFSKTKLTIARTLLEMNFEGHYSVSPCGGILTDPEQNVTSPEYPNNYPPNVHCAWAVNFPEDLRISVKFNTLELEDQCLNDYVLIYNGPLPTSPLIDRFCGSNRPANDIISQGNSLWIEFHSNGDRQFKGFSLSLTSITTGCGGVIHSKERHISSPNYPNQYPPNTECEWEIRTEEGYFIQLQIIERFQIEQSDNCNSDFVEIFDYYNNEYVLQKKLCGREIQRVMNSTGSRMKIRFKSNENIQGDGFKAQWSPQCGGIIENVTSGIIVSPNYPRDYDNYLNCKYIVKMPGHFIRAQFNSFDLEGGSCRFDNVSIEGPPRWSSVMQRGPYCGTVIPPGFVSWNTFTLIFKSDYSVTRSGFLLTFSSLTSCGGSIDEPGILTAPDVFMEDFHVQLNCTWTITAPASSVVVLRFSSFFLGQYCDVHMRNFGMNIYDGPYVDDRFRKASYCGDLDRSPPVVQSSGNKMVVEYSTYSFNARTTRFTADVIFTYGPSVGCGGRKNITTQAQTIRSPDVNNDGLYEPSLDCHWVLKAQPNQIIRLQINSLQLKPCRNTTAQSSNYCACDYIEIRDGGTQYDELHGVYCASQTYRPILSSSSQLWIRFVTDAYEEDAGFSIQAQAQQFLCSQPLLNVTSKLKVLTSQNYPNNYPPDLRCQWLLSAPRPYMRIAVHIEDLNITGEADCSNSKLEISEDMVSDIVTTQDGGSVVIFGQGHQSRPINYAIPVSSYTFCGEVTNFNYYSLSGRVSVTFVSNEMVSRGFNLSYSLTECNRNYTSPQGRIFLNGQMHNCVMVIETIQNATISLYFRESLVMENCDRNGLEIRDGATADSPRLRKICGGAGANPIFSTGNFLRITATSQHMRLDATYTTTTQGRGCGGDIFNYAGIFTSPLYPTNYRNGSVCEWNIMVPVGKLATLKFNVFDLGPISTCETDYIDLISVDMPENTEGAQTRYCGEDDPAIFVSTSNKLIVRYTTSIHNSGTGWVALFMGSIPGRRVIDDSFLNHMYGW